MKNIFSNIFSKNNQTSQSIEEVKPVVKELTDSDVYREIAVLQGVYLENIMDEFQRSMYAGGYVNQNGSGRENYPVFDLMDSGDGSAILDIYASATITNSPVQGFRPYEIHITPRFQNVDVSENMMKFIHFNEEISGLFNTLHGVARDGFKYGSAFEKITYGKSPMFGNRGVIIGLESIRTPTMYPLHAEGSGNISEYMEEKDTSIDFYDRSRFIEGVDSTNTGKMRVFYPTTKILPFFNRSRSFDWMGNSIFQPMVEEWNNKKSSEAKVVLQRMTRSAQKLIHSIETAGQTDAMIKSKISLLQSLNGGKKKIAEVSGYLKQKQFKVEQDSDMITFLYEGKGGVTPITGDGDIKSMRDVDYWRHSMYTIAHIPPSYILDATLKNASRDAVGEMDKMFETIISTGRRRLFETFLRQFYETIIDLYFNRIGEYQKYKIELRWLPISTLEEMRREKSLQIRSMIAKIWRLDLDMPDEVIYRKIFKMNSREIGDIQALPKPDPLVYKNNQAPIPTKGQNTTSPKTTPKPVVKKKEDFEKIIDQLSEFHSILGDDLDDIVEILKETIEEYYE